MEKSFEFCDTELMSIWIEITRVYREGAEPGRFYYLTQLGQKYKIHINYIFYQEKEKY